MCYAIVLIKDKKPLRFAMNYVVNNNNKRSKSKYIEDGVLLCESYAEIKVHLLKIQAKLKKIDNNKLSAVVKQF